MASTRGYRSVTVGGIEIRSQISLGNIIQVLVIVGGLGAMWARTESRVAEVQYTQDQISDRIERQRLSIDSQMVDARGRLGALEIANARSDEKFSNILSILSRIEKRLDETN